LSHIHARIRSKWGETVGRYASLRALEAWTDQRLDDLAATLRPVPAQLARNTEAIARLTDELRSARADISALRGDFAAMQRQVAQIGWALSGALVGVLVALLVAVA
jgi:nitrogen fixation/metabolism regulation signal transduction histidine kinase